MFKLKSLMAVLVAAVFLFQAGPAHAYLGVKSSQTEEKIAKGGMGLSPAVALGLPFLGASAGGGAPAGISLGLVLGIGAAIVVVVAVFLVLDEDGTGQFYYYSVSPEDATALGLTPTEAAAFNQNVDTVNAVLNELRWSDVQDYEAAWQFYADELGWDSNVRAAVAKMNAYMYQAITQ